MTCQYPPPALPKGHLAWLCAHSAWVVVVAAAAAAAAAAAVGLFAALPGQ